MASFLEQLIQRAGTAGQQMGTPAVLDELSQLIKGGVGGAGSVMSNVPGMQPSGEALTALANLIPQEKPKDAVQYMTENARKLGISEIHQGVDEAGGHSVKVKFDTATTPAPEAAQSITAEATPQGNPLQLLKALLSGGGATPATGNYVAAPNPLALGGLNQQGNYEDQGALVKLAQLISVGGGKPGTGPLEASAIQRMAGKEPVQEKELREQAAAGYSAKVDLLNKGLERIKAEEDAAKAYVDEKLKTTFMGGKAGGAGKLMKDYRDTLGELAKQRKGLHDQMAELFTQHPNVKASAKEATTQYKAGDKRVVGGKVVTRDANGNWR